MGWSCVRQRGAAWLPSCFLFDVNLAPVKHNPTLGVNITYFYVVFNDVRLLESDKCGGISMLEYGMWSDRTFSFYVCI